MRRFHRPSAARSLSLLTIACVVASFSSTAAAATVWQWSIPVKGGREPAGPARAFLWIPEKCQIIRAIVIAQNNMQEQSILENPKFRAALSDMHIAEVFVSPSFDHLFRFNEGAGETFESMMSDLAAESGYSELKTTPAIPVGHSAAASWPYYLAAWKPNRVLAALSISGQWPYARGIYAPDIWGDRTIDFIPCLESMGEYEAAATWSADGLKERQQHPLTPLSMLANPAQGHFAATDKKIDYLALYIKKALQYRLTDQLTPDGSPKLNPIDPTKTGWLADKWRFNQPPTAPTAPVGLYKGDPAQAFWFFDEELAHATEAYQADHRGQKPQLVGYLQEGGGGKLVPQTNTHLQIQLKFQPQSDGITFKLAGGFYDSVPGGSPRPTIWAALPVGSPIGHAGGGGDISIDRIIGPIEKIAPDTFRISFDKTGIGPGAGPNGPATSPNIEIDFAATHPGDDEYKPAVQQAQMMIPARNTRGPDQHLTFPEIPDQPQSTRSLKLTATSDANVSVSFYIIAGPAQIQGDMLTFTPIPPRAKFPVKITVVAWQYGCSTDPPLKTAAPIERTFFLTR